MKQKLQKRGLGLSGKKMRDYGFAIISNVNEK